MLEIRSFETSCTVLSSIQTSADVVHDGVQLLAELTGDVVHVTDPEFKGIEKYIDPDPDPDPNINPDPLLACNTELKCIANSEPGSNSDKNDTSDGPQCKLETCIPSNHKLYTISTDHISEIKPEYEVTSESSIGSDPVCPNKTDIPEEIKGELETSVGTKLDHDQSNEIKLYPDPMNASVSEPKSNCEPVQSRIQFSPAEGGGGGVLVSVPENALLTQVSV